MKPAIHIGEGLILPIEFVTQTQAILAKKRVGKSYTASVEAEELLKAHQQICVIDPTGAWWGLKSSADGRNAGYPIAVFGGEHADVPLEESAGETIAQAIVEQRFSAIIDLSLLRKGQVNRFMAPFLETLYRLNREAMHLFVDEADAIAPQKPFGEEARMLGAMEDVVRRGGIRGIGTTLITQRPAVLNKNVLTQCEILCALRIVHHKDIDAIREWIEVHGDEKTAEAMIKSLPALPIGTAWFWAPGWGDIFQQVKVRQRYTFDSGATPKPGETKRTAKVLATVDLEKLGKQIEATVQRAKENNPAELKKEIKRLQSLVNKPQPVPEKIASSVKSDRAAIRRLKSALEIAMKIIVNINAVGFDGAGITGEEINKALILASEQISKLAQSKVEARNRQLERLQKDAASALEKINKIASDESLDISVELKRNDPYTVTAPAPASRMVHMPASTNGNGNGDHGLTGPERKILRALAELRSIGKEQAPKNMVAAWAGYSPIGGAFGNPIGALRSKGLIDYPQAGMVCLTTDGLFAVGECQSPDQEEIWRRIENTCSGPEQKILRALIDNAGEKEISKSDLAEKSGYSPIGGAFGNPIGALRTKGLLDYPRAGFVKAADWLFI